MGTSNGRESCGRCSFTTIVDTVESTASDDDDESRDRHDPFAGGYIEVDERELRMANAPAVLAGRVKAWIDETAYRYIHDQ